MIMQLLVGIKYTRGGRGRERGREKGKGEEGEEQPCFQALSSKRGRGGLEMRLGEEKVEMKEEEKEEENEVEEKKEKERKEDNM